MPRGLTGDTEAIWVGFGGVIVTSTANERASVSLSCPAHM